MTSSKSNEPAVRVVGLCGSIRSGSYTRMALAIALQGAEEAGADTHLIDLRDYELIFCDGKRDESQYPNDVIKLRKMVRGAQGLILGTPEYHGGFSGVLKNALDLMGFAEFEGKMIGLIGVSGGALGAVNALSSLRSIGRALHAWLVPEQASVPGARKAFDKNGRLHDKGLEERVKTVGRQVARFAYLHSSKKAQAFMEAWEGAPENPGGGNK